jgi:hypothetical protein
VQACSSAKGYHCSRSKSRCNYQYLRKNTNNEQSRGSSNIHRTSFPGTRFYRTRSNVRGGIDCRRQGCNVRVFRKCWNTGIGTRQDKTRRVLATVADRHFGSGSGSEPNRCQIGGPGCQHTRTVDSGTVRCKSPNTSGLGGLSAGRTAGPSVDLYNVLVFAVA